MKNIPQASIVIINKNDRGIEQTLKALLVHKSRYIFDITVVDASAGRLLDIAKRYPVHWINFEPSPKKLISIPEQRNAGVMATRAPIIVFTDANCIPLTGWLDALLDPIYTQGEAIVAGSTHSQRSNSLHDQNFDLRGGIKYLYECPTINMAFKREVFDGLGGFDGYFDYGSDVDFSWRALGAGYKIRYVPQAGITHDWGGVKDNIKRAYRYGVARARLYKKHPSKYHQLFSHDLVMVVYAGYILGLPLTAWLWWYPLLISVLVIKNIRNHPLQVVRYHLIYAAGALRELVRVRAM